MRVSVIKTSPFIKNFFEKMVELEKGVKLVVDILSEWTTFQKNWIYLENIFKMDEISKQLENATKKFI